jgi:two-component system NtrC family sensor kinase
LLNSTSAQALRLRPDAIREALVISQVPWWNRIGVRLAGAIVLVTVASMAGLMALVLRSQRAYVERRITDNAAMLSETIRSSTYHAMLDDRRIEVYRIMATVGRQERVESVRIFNKEGRITFSTAAGEIGRSVDTRAESCYACHAADQPLQRLNLPSRSRIYWHNGHRVVGMVTPIYNERACSTAPCHVHPESKSVLGVVDVGLSLEALDAQLGELQRTTVTVGVLASLVLVGIVGFYTRRYVTKPVTRLMEGTRRVAEGNLRQDVPVDTSTELGALEQAFNEMAHAVSRARAERIALLQSLEQKVDERTAELRAAQARMVQSEKLSSLGRLAASIAHEINNPLAGILTYAKLIIRTMEGQGADRESAAAVKQLRLIQRETERCTAIVRNLLDFARERPLTLKDIGVHGAIEEALMLVSHQAKLQNVTLERDLQEDGQVHADFGQLRQAFINIIINACDAMAGGGTLKVSTRRGQGTVDVEFTDSGCGIPPEHLTKILDPFFTTKDKGTGLGLSVVYGIVERHNGRLEIDSEVGRGTTVRIRLPLVPGGGGTGAIEPSAARTA